jgi:hypothetical protein
VHARRGTPGQIRSEWKVIDTFEVGSAVEDLELDLEPTTTSTTNLTVGVHAADGTELFAKNVSIDAGTADATDGDGSDEGTTDGDASTDHADSDDDGDESTDADSSGDETERTRAAMGPTRRTPRATAPGSAWSPRSWPSSGRSRSPAAGKHPARTHLLRARPVSGDAGHRVTGWRVAGVPPGAPTASAGRTRRG